MRDLVTLSHKGGIALITIDNPPVNALSRRLLEQLLLRFQEAERTPDCHALVLCATGRTFACGADITQLDNPVTAENDAFNPVMNAIESLSKPVVCSMHGMALGGGLELAMACHYRVAHAQTRMGLPEVTLGIVPGAGGTQRLPRLIGPRAALDMISTGKTVDADTALALGLIDSISQEPDAAQAGLTYALHILNQRLPVRPTRDLAVDSRELDDDALKRALDAAGRNTAYPAMRAIVECIQAAIRLPFFQGREIEGRLFEACRASDTSAALRHIFFAEREAAKLPAISPSVAQRPIRHIGVIGAGTMGRGIIMNFLDAGISSVLVDARREALEDGIALIRRTYESRVARGRMSSSQSEAALALLNSSMDYADVSQCDLVIEAVFEDIDVKTKPDAIIATNTSTLDVDVLAQASGRPGNFLGMHFFSPAHIMRLVEIVRGRYTQPDVLATVSALAKTIRKVSVVSGVCYGFIGNRMLESYLRETDFLLMEGATPGQIDQAIEAAGMAMGPCRMLDMAGVDIAAKILLEQGKAGIRPPDPRYRAVVSRLFERGRMGQKNHHGYYRHEGRNAIDDPEVAALCESLASQHGIRRRTDISNSEIVERCIFPLINEGCRILEEGIAYRPGDIDIVWTKGYGFPDYRGGPIFLADHIGAATVLDRLLHYSQLLGNEYGYWTPASLLVEHAAHSRPLSQWRAPAPTHEPTSTGSQS
jgi:3-hydroxyacyl-CoA dehydrogenase